MPGKSQHKHGKHSSRSKRRIGGPSQPVMATQPTPTEPAREIIAPRQIPKAPVTTAATAVKYPYIFTELRRIGILSGVMLVILFILALVLA